MKTTLQNEKASITFTGSRLSITGNGLKINIPINSDTLLKTLSSKSQVSVSVDVEINKK